MNVAYVYFENDHNIFKSQSIGFKNIEREIGWLLGPYVLSVGLKLIWTRQLLVYAIKSNGT